MVPWNGDLIGGVIVRLDVGLLEDSMIADPTARASSSYSSSSSGVVSVKHWPGYLALSLAEHLPPYNSLF